MAQMTVEEFAKKLQSETGMVFHWRTIAKDLVKKKEGLKASSMINDDDMTYVRNKYVKTEEKKPEPKKSCKACCPTCCCEIGTEAENSSPTYADHRWTC